MKYPRQLSQGANNVVIALNEKEVAKIYTGDTRSDIGSEAEKLKYANNINGLLPAFYRLDFEEEWQADMLVMERIYPIDFRSYEVERRQLWLDVFLDEMHQLHKGGFVHRDIRRPSDIGGQPFDNVLLTEKGLRLIDAGISALQHQVGDKLFSKYLEVENRELGEFGQYFLSR